MSAWRRLAGTGSAMIVLGDDIFVPGTSDFCSCFARCLICCSISPRSLSGRSVSRWWVVSCVALNKNRKWLQTSAEGRDLPLHPTLLWLCKRSQSTSNLKARLWLKLVWGSGLCTTARPRVIVLRTSYQASLSFLSLGFRRFLYQLYHAGLFPHTTRPSPPLPDRRFMATIPFLACVLNSSFLPCTQLHSLSFD